ncbi:ABC transporter ATP-binding protein [Dinghuibacter silviterrae]|uniref:ABC-2 type transport system ATP-binding protein/bacitracin transport system ATP-binding protein n=1 Tax=Dinghuibacter silviterrae TaxID=1539049 RepID=A0A4R8DPW0_9BACT|nr:ABC transporter ATP-binding protein [Dinghuibacter silviterrae]TDX00144.1 ABC-2 type transport system ATP-binding protein/bacitracin transport system ATP-binding protein [Dinghuibacter silviterrae]
MAVIARIGHLSKHFDSLTAVDDLSFTVEEGDVYGFLGQNGAGKSTTLRMLLSLIRPSGGDIELFGLSLATHRKQILRQVGAVIEQPELYPFFTGLENLRVFARLSGKPLKRAALLEHLEVVGLAGRADDKTGTYSMGMKQRLGLAVALVHDPALLILDEPTNGLDPQGIADMRNLILSLSRDRKKTLIVSSHLLSEIQILATRMLIIDKGRKVVEGAADTLLNPADTLVHLETEDMSRTLELLHASDWAGAIHGVAPLVLKIHRSRIPQLNADLVAWGVGVTRLEPRHSLEDYFLQLTASAPHVAPFAH